MFFWLTLIDGGSDVKEGGYHDCFTLNNGLGATSIDKISEDWLSDKKGEGLKFWKERLYNYY